MSSLESLQWNSKLLQEGKVRQWFKGYLEHSKCFSTTAVVSFVDQMVLTSVMEITKTINSDVGSMAEAFIKKKTRF